MRPGTRRQEKQRVVGVNIGLIQVEVAPISYWAILMPNQVGPREWVLPGTWLLNRALRGLNVTANLLFLPPPRLF